MRTDPYYWLRERDDPEVIRYLEAENAYLEEMMADTEELQDRLFAEITGRNAEQRSLAALEKVGSPEALAQPGGGVSGFFYVALNDRAFMGVRAREPLRVRELIPEFMELSGQIPGSIVVVALVSGGFAAAAGGNLI